jgi:hypothetical protein
VIVAQGRQDQDQAVDQPPEVRIAAGRDGAGDPAEGPRGGMGPQGEPGDHAESPAAATAQRPEQVRVLGGVRDHDLAGSQHHLGLQHVAGRRAVTARQAPESAALDEPARRADGHARSALDVAAVRQQRLVSLQPPGPGPDRDHQPGTVLAGEIDRRGNVGGRLSRDYPRAVRRHVRPMPARSVKGARVVLDRVRVTQARQRRPDIEQTAADPFLKRGAVEFFDVALHRESTRPICGRPAPAAKTQELTSRQSVYSASVAASSSRRMKPSGPSSAKEMPGK